VLNRVEAGIRAFDPCLSCSTHAAGQMPLMCNFWPDANEAAASVAYRMNEVMVIYPITPSSPMAEWCDEWSANGPQTNLWGMVPSVTEMQSEGGAASAPFTARCRRAAWRRPSPRRRACC
jgi:hypothetical protein